MTDTSIFTKVGELATFVWEQIANVADTIMNNELLLIGVVGIPLVGFAVGIISRLLSQRV